MVILVFLALTDLLWSWCRLFHCACLILHQIMVFMRHPVYLRISRIIYEYFLAVYTMYILKSKIFSPAWGAQPCNVDYTVWMHLVSSEIRPWFNFQWTLDKILPQQRTSLWTIMLDWRRPKHFALRSFYFLLLWRNQGLFTLLVSYIFYHERTKHSSEEVTHYVIL